MRDKLSHDYLGLDLEITWKASVIAHSRVQIRLTLLTRWV
jgi:uncharacterized protein with HEPN domain